MGCLFWVCVGFGNFEGAAQARVNFGIGYWVLGIGLLVFDILVVVWD